MQWRDTINLNESWITKVIKESFYIGLGIYFHITPYVYNLYYNYQAHKDAQ